MVQKGNGILARLFAFRLHPKRVTTWWVTGYWLLCIPEHQISTSLKSDQTPTSPNLLLVFVCFQNYVNITCFCTYHYIATEIRRNKHNSSRFLEYERLNLLHGRLGVYRDAHITTLPSSIVYLVSLVFSNLTILNTMTCTVPHRKRTRLGINQHHERHQRTMNVW